MVLNTEGARIRDFEAFHCLVVEIQMCHHRLVTDACLVHRKAVVLGRYLYTAGLQVLHRLIGTSVTKLHLIGLSTHRAGENLMPQANPEDGQLAEQRRNRLVRPGDRGGVSGSIGEKDAMWAYARVPPPVR